MMREHTEKLPIERLRLLMVTSCVILLQGWLILCVADMWGPHKKGQSANLRSVPSTGTHIEFNPMNHKMYLELEYSVSAYRLAYASILTGLLSVLNYAMYTGRINIYSVLDFVMAVVGSIIMFWETIKWILRGNVSMVFILGWNVSTVALYVFRKDPGEQVIVHLSGILSVLCWTCIAATHIQTILG